MKGLSGRERKLILAAAGACAVFLAYQFGLSPLFNYYEQMQEDLPRLKGDLLTARRLHAKFATINREMGDIRARLEARTSEFNPHDFLSTLARKEGILSNLEDIKIDSKEVTAGYREETATVRLKKVPLSKLVSYLYGIENSGLLLTVKELKIEPDRADSTLLDANFDASTFIKSGAKEEPAEKKPPAKKPRPARR